MDHLLSQWTKREICAHRQRLSMRTPDAALLQATPIPARVLTGLVETGSPEVN